MKKTLLITAAALAAAMFPTARAAEKIPYSRAYVSVLTKAAVELPADAKKRRIETWKMGKGETACNLVRYNHYSQNPREWSNASFKFKALEDGTAKITLLFAEIKANGKVVPYGAYYDDVRVNGKLLPNGDFENDFDKWEIYCPQKNGISPKAEFRESITGGGKCARVSRLGSISQAFKIKAGETYEISFRTKYAGILSAADDDFPLDLSKFFNYGGGSKVMAKVALPDPKIPEGGVDIEGVRFASKPADGKRALVLRNKLSPVVPHAVEIALTPDQTGARYLYVLHAASSAHQGGLTLGRIVCFGENGVSLSKRECVVGRDAGWANEHGRGMNAKCVEVDGGSVYFSRFYIPKNTKKIMFQSYYKSPWIIYAATLSESFRYPFETFTPSPDKWTRIDIDRSYCDVKSGSALDLSGLVQTPVPAGATGRAIISKRGAIAFEKTPDADARFKSYSLWQVGSFAKIPAEERHAAIKKYASMLRPQGYNLVRLHLDILKSRELLPLRDEYYDIVDCLFAELKKNGVYYQIVLGAYNDGRAGYTFDYRDDVKMLAIIGDKETWNNWKKFTQKWLNHVNPYTGIAWKDDPALLSLEYYNELTICLGRLYRLTPEVRSRTLKKFAKFLEKKYKTVDKLNESWNNAKMGNVYDFKSFDEVPTKAVYAKNFDWLFFAWKGMNEFGKFAEGVVRGAGYKGLISECNTAGSFAGRAYANRFTDVVIINTYYSHPQGGFASTDVTCSQASGIGDDWITNSVVSRK
ncbi:MAG: beta-galactosidase, partial [Opitutales bacterium]|nr:beta-galactosidase [Opitutales bacterium]